MNSSFPKASTNYRHLVKLAMMVCFCGFGVVSFSGELQAECGGYVTIGNKTKLKELQAAGYLPVMKRHSSQKDLGDNRTNESDLQTLDAKPKESLPTVPCSGPNCRNGKSGFPMPKPVPTTPSISIKSCVQTSKDFVVFCPSAFVGFRAENESPAFLSQSFFRPPE